MGRRAGTHPSWHPSEGSGWRGPRLLPMRGPAPSLLCAGNAGLGAGPRRHVSLANCMLSSLIRRNMQLGATYLLLGCLQMKVVVRPPRPRLEGWRY
jgi:hypothetical protein